MSEKSHRSLVELLRRRAADDTQENAYTFLDEAGVEPAGSIGYRELDRRAREIAARLQAAGLTGERALLFYPPGLEFIAAFFGCLYAGVVAVPGYPPRSRRGLPRVAAVAADAEAAAVLASAEDLPKLLAIAAATDEVAAALGGLRWIATDEPASAGSTEGGLADDWRDPGCGPQTLAFLQYTSGSTAAPKGVMVSHGNLLANQEQIRLAFRQSAASVVVGWLPLYHDMGLIGNVLQPLYLGARCILMSPLAFLQRPRRWLEAIGRYRATTSGGPNFAYELCVRKIPPSERQGLELASWRVAFNGAEPVRAQTLDRFAAAFSPHGFSRRAFLPCYGLAEATLLVSGEPPAEEPRVVELSAAGLERGRAESPGGEGETATRSLVACGEVAAGDSSTSPGSELHGQRVLVVDPAARRPLPEGTVGEIWVQGLHVAGGYWRQPELSAETFEARLEDGAGDSAGGDVNGPFLRTGDLGFLSAGRLFVTGRSKDLIIIRGRNLYPQDVEITVERAHPALRAGCGVAFSVDQGGEERLVVVQEVQRTAIRSLDLAKVAERIRTAVVEAHQVAIGSVVLLPPGGVPKTSSGKVQRRRCRQQLLAGELTVLHRSDATSRSAVSPRSPGESPVAAEGLAAAAVAADPAAGERWVATILAAAAEVLETPAEKLGRDRPLPLDSLAAMELKARLEGETGRRLPLAELFDGPSADSIAAALAAAPLAAAAATAPVTAPATAEPGSEAPLEAATAAGEPPPSEIELSEGQRALWLLDRLDGSAADRADSGRYQVAVAARLGEGTDLDALRRAVERLTERHPLLTASIAASPETGLPVQRLAAVAGTTTQVWRTVPASDWSDRELEERLVEDAYRRFDLEGGPPFRALLYRRPGGDTLLLAFHHLAIDLWSLVVLARELAALYSALRAGETLPLAAADDVERTAELARQQRHLLASAEGERLAEFWRRTLEDAPRVLDLPTDRPRSADRRGRAGTVFGHLPGSLVAALTALAGERGATRFAALLTGFQALLSRWCGMDDLLVGTPAAGRSRPGLERLVGYRVNPLPLRARLGDDPPFAAAVQETGRRVIEGLEHQDYPFPRIARDAAAGGGDHGGGVDGGRVDGGSALGRSPLIQALFAFERPHRDLGGDLSGFVLGRGGSRLELGDLALESMALPKGGVQFDLELVAVESGTGDGEGGNGGGVELALHYAADLFDRTSAERLLAAYRRLLEGAAARPELPVHELPLLDDAERRQLLVEWPWRSQPWRPLALHQLFAEWVERTPDAPAVLALGPGSGSGGEESLTYAELDAASEALARRLRQAGAGPEVRVAVSLPRSPALVAAFLATLRAGACYLPLDPAYPAERLRYMLADSGAAIALTTASGAESLGLRWQGDGEPPAPEAGRPHLLLLDGVAAPALRQSGNAAGAAAAAVERGVRPAAAVDAEAVDPEAVHPDAAAYAIYTSGSTGQPKGAVLTHRGLANLAQGQAAGFGVTAGDRVLLFAALSFDASISEMAMVLAAGATVAIARRRDLMPGPPLLAAIERLGVTHVTLPPSVLAALPDPAEQVERLRSLGTVISAGETLPAPLATLWSASRRLINGYGPTENTVCVSFGDFLGAGDGDKSGGSGGSEPAPPSIGRPLENVRCLVLDRRFRPVPVGVPGELMVGGVGLARGYLGRPGLTAERFVPDPTGGRADGSRPLSSPGSRLYRTGDRVSWRPGGELRYHGRLDEQVKVRGFRVEPAEIEAALAACAGVAECVVAVRGEGAGRARLVGYVVPGRGAGRAFDSAAAFDSAPAFDSAAVRRELEARLPEHQIPGAFVILDRLPRTPAGKLDRRSLPAPEAAPGSLGTVPAGELEREVAAIWCDVLGLAAVGAEDNFFDLGGHSLLVAQIHRRLAGVLPREVSLVDLFRYPTVRSLVRFAAGSEPAGGGAVARATLRAGARRRRALAGRSADESEGGARATPAIAVIGLACRFPGAADPAALWRLLEAGEEAARDFTDEELLAAGVDRRSLDDPSFVKAGIELSGIDRFDAGYFRYNPAEAAALDPQQRLFLECAVEALEDAGCDPDRFDGAVGVFAGAGMESYLFEALLARRAAGGGLVSGVGDPAAEYQLSVGNLRDFLATRVSYLLGLSGPSVAVQTACSTSLVAVHLACQSLLAGECDLALAGGVSLEIPPGRGYRHQEGMILSPDGRCRPFSADAAGTVRGSGAGVVTLARLDDALAAGERVRAVLLGSAINNDGDLKVGFTAPSPRRQAEVIAEAQAVAGVEPASVTYVEAHGTGTELGDPIEVEALTEAFGGSAGQAAGGRCLLGSIKSNLGHCDAAAGVAGLLKTVLALEHGRLPASLHCQRTHPGIDFAATPFRVLQETVDWRPPDGAPRRAGVSSFGIGGTNAHVVLEEAPPAGRQPLGGEARRWQLLTLSAASPAALDGAGERLSAHFGALAGSEPDGATQSAHRRLADAAYTLHVGRRGLARRRVAVAQDAASAVAVLTGGHPDRVFEGIAVTDREVAFLFPGQGAQHPGMAEALYRDEPAFRRDLDRSAERLSRWLGCDLRRLLYPAAGEETAAAAALAETRITQPALFAVEHALAVLWREWGVEPAAMLGHSVGELVAGCLAGTLSYDDALSLVAERGRLMQAMPTGSMLSVALPAGEIESLLAPADGELTVAAVNGPGATVVAGPDSAVDRLAARLAEGGVGARRLRTSHAFHSPAMDEAAERFAETVSRVELSPPAIPWLSNVTGTWIAAAQATDPGYWGGQLRRPVLFAAAVGELLADARRVLLEVGPGDGLATLVRRHPAMHANPLGGGAAAAGAPAPARLVLSSLPHPRRQAEAADAQAVTVTAAGRMWAAGVELDWAGFHRYEARRKAALPTYAFDRRRYWLPSAAVDPAPIEPPGVDPLATPAALADWFHLPAWCPEPAPVAAVPAESRWLLLVDETGLGAEMIRQLRAAGCAVVAVTPGDVFARRGPSTWSLRPGESGDYEQLLAALAGERPIDHVVHLWTVAADGAGGTATGEPAAGGAACAPEEALECSFFSLLALAQALGRRRLAPAVTVVSSHARSVGGEEPVAERATTLAASRVLPLELSGLVCRSIDVEPLRTTSGSGAAIERLARRLLADVAAGTGRGADRSAGDPQPAAAYRAGGRWVEELRPVRLGAPATAEDVFPSGGVCWITGGFGGLGSAVARHLAERYGARLVLTGRSAPAKEPGAAGAGLDDDPRRAQVRELEALGAEVLSMAADAADQSRMTEVARRVDQRFGRLDLVIHAAGVAGGGVVQGRGRSAAAAVLAPKVAGTRALLAALERRPPAALILFSSLASAVGGFGQLDYAAANCAVDAFAEAWSARHPETYACAVGWGGWREVGMGVGAAALPGGGISTRDGLEALERVLAHRPGPRVLVTPDPPAEVARLHVRLARDPVAALAETLGEATAAAAATDRHPRPDLQTPYIEPSGELEELLSVIWRRLLGLDRVGVHDNFFELGGTSLLGIQVVSEVRKATAVELPAVSLYEASTVRALAGLLAAAKKEVDPADPAPEADAAAPGAGRGARRRQRMARRREAASAAAGEER